MGETVVFLLGCKLGAASETAERPYVRLPSPRGVMSVTDFINLTMSSNSIQPL